MRPISDQMMQSCKAVELPLDSILIATLQTPALHSALTPANQRKRERFLASHLTIFAPEPKRTTNTL